jgi:peptidoglycan hydrolase-like protein with peptidoglycan-binding domain
MKKLALAGVALIALSLPAVAMDQQDNSTKDGNGTMGQATEGANPMTDGQSKTLSPEKLDKSVVMQVQKALDGKGFDPGRSDGVWGPETVAAIKKFQQKNDLKPDGKLDRQTVAALGLSKEEPTTTGSGASSDRADEAAH